MPRPPKQIIEPIKDGSFEDVSEAMVKRLLKDVATGQGKTTVKHSTVEDIQSDDDKESD